MTATAAALPHLSEDRHTTLWLNVAVLWHAGFALLLAASGIFLLVSLADSTIPIATGLRVFLIALSLLGGVSSACAAIFITRRDQRGRMLSLVINYLGFVVCLAFDLHILGVYVGLDVLAGTFKYGLPFLLLGFIGYLIGAWGDRHEDFPQRQQAYRRLSQTISLIAAGLWLLSVGLLEGLRALLQQFNSPLPFILTAGIAVFAVLLRAVGRRSVAEALHTKRQHEETLTGLLFLSPNLLGFLLFFAAPLLFSLLISFTNSDAFNPPDWVGLQNYQHLLNVTIQPLSSSTQLANEVLDVKIYNELARFEILGQSYVIGAQDKLFWLALRNTLVYCLMAVPVSVIPALLLATLLNSKLPGMKLFRAVYFLPSVAAIVGIALIWQWLYNSAIGYINYFISLTVNFANSLFNAGWVDPKLQWLSDSNSALIAIALMAVWATLGFNIVLFLSGLQSIPRDLYEAATVDGANPTQQFFAVTVPMLAPTTFFVLTTTTIQAMQLFEQVFILSNPLGGPNNSTLSLVVYLYQNGFQRFRQGYASATAWVLFIVIFGLTLFQYRRQRSSSGAYEG
ncbi:Lactose transport system permease protein LacF [Thermoflexales bacterium]|nr:Lactose transport system permease protein LacF [Thermoflexales bacterium]